MAPITEETNPLFTPTTLGPYKLEHRIALAPLTRCRAVGRVTATESAAKYYSMRATAGGFMLTEATGVSPYGEGYPDTPEIAEQKHVDAWKPVFDAVHAKGAIFWMQIWHCGRAAHPFFLPDNSQSVGPSALAVPSSQKCYVPGEGLVEYPPPRELSVPEIKEIVEQFRVGARNAMAAGADGVELHGANGYLVDQFLKDSSNQRSDEYGGSIENRIRFLKEVLEAIIAEVGADKVGVRLSPYGQFLGTPDSDPVALFLAVIEAIQPLGLAYIHMVEGRVAGNADIETTTTLEPFRKAWKGKFIAAGGYDAEKAAKAISSGHADVIVFGRHFVSTPDLVKRIKLGKAFNSYNRDTFYSPGEPGYLEGYPTLEELESNST